MYLESKGRLLLACLLMATGWFFMFNWRALGQTGRFKLDLQRVLDYFEFFIWILAASLILV